MVNAFLRNAWQDVSVGCALGLNVGSSSDRAWLPNTQRWVGVDLRPGAGTAYQADVYRLPHRPGVYDVAQCAEMLYQLAEPGVALVEIARVLKPGGELVATVPFIHPPMPEGDLSRHTAAFWDRTLQAAGYVHIQIEPLGGPWAGLCQLAHRCGPSWLAKAARWLTMRLRWLDRGREHHWPLAWGITAWRP